MSEPVEAAETTALDQPPQPQQHVKPVIPEGMSKSQWKKQQRKQRFLERKSEFQEIRKVKKQRAKQARREKIQEYVAKGEAIPENLLNKRAQVPKDQEKIGSSLIIDCDFDELMSEKEVISLASQITRSYSSNRTAQKNFDIKVTSFNKSLKKRFEEDLKDSKHTNWPNVSFQEEEFKADDVSKYIYLSADSSEVLSDLSPDLNYIIGGIVDKGRYKNLCKDKAEKLGIKTARLPIDEYIKLSGRRVLTTTHVVELMLKWFEFRDWKQAFETVLPQRKIIDNDDREVEDDGEEREEDRDEEGEEEHEEDEDANE